MTLEVQWRRAVPLALLLGAGAAAIAPAGPDALLAVKAAAADSTEVAVAFVVDFGTGSAQGVLEGCVKVPSSDTGYDALAAFVQQAGLSEPSYNSAGLLCSIGGVPSSGCGVASNGEYIFWSYWHGTTGTWQYSSTGAFSLATNDVEGWRFQNPGPDNATAPPPGATPNYASICPAADQPTTTPTTTGAAPAPVAAPGGATASGGVPAGGAAASAHTATTSPASGGSAAGATTSTPATTATTSPTSGAHASVGSAASKAADPKTPAVHHVTESLGATKAAPSSSAVPLIVGGAIVVLLGAGAAVLWRRRLRSP